MRCSWAVLGSGPVSWKFARALTSIGEGVSVKVVASQQLERAQALANQVGAEATDDYQAAISAKVDAVYVATPPALHEEQAIASMQAGKATLIEKPIADTSAAAERIATTAAQTDVMCMEGMWTRFQPLLTRIRQLLEQGAVGEIVCLDGGFGSPSSPMSQHSLWSADLGGGALLHRGVYVISLATFLAGAVTEQRGTLRVGSQGVDEHAEFLLTHSGDATTHGRASLITQANSPISVFGTHGTLTLSGPVYRPTGARLHRWAPPPIAPEAPTTGGLRDQLRASRLAHSVEQRAPSLRTVLGRRTATRIRAPYRGEGYEHEAVSFMRAMQDGQQESMTMPLHESVAIMKVVDSLRAQETPVEAR